MDGYNERNYEYMNRIVIYGGNLPAIAAAARAASTAMTATIHLVVPYVPHKLGGIATVGGQNYWDYVSPLIQQGSFSLLSHTNK